MRRRRLLEASLALLALSGGCASRAARDASTGDAADDAVSHGGDATTVDAPTDGALPDASATACTPPPTPVAPPTLAALDCMAVGLVARDAAGSLPPALPFYQPSVDAASIDAVVPSPPGLPTSNHFTLLDGWDGPRALVPIASWDLGGYTGLVLPGPAGATQRGQVDAFGQSGVQLAGTTAGLWLNTQDAAVVLYSGSGSINTGCWYQTPPYAPMFPSLAHQLDVAFDVGVGYDGSTGNAHTQAYFQLIAVDRSGHCGTHCAFSFSVGFYSRTGSIATSRGVSGDATGTLSTPLAGAGIDATGWLHSMPDSMHYQTAVFAPRHVHLRIASGEFAAIRDGVAAFAPGVYDALSTDARDYGLALLNVNGEAYDPCKDPTHIAPCTGSDHAQLGLSVGAFRVTTTVPHAAAGAPSGFDAPGFRAAYRDADGSIAVFADASGTGGFGNTALAAAGTAAGDPSGRSSGGVARVAFRDVGNRVRVASSSGGAWTLADAGGGAAIAYSDPMLFADASDAPRVVERDIVGDVHVQSLDAAGWHDADVTRAATPVPAAALGSPRGFVAGTSPCVVFVDGAHHVWLLRFARAAWTARDLTLATSAADAYSDPMGFGDADGFAHAVDRDVTGVVHEFYEDASGWHVRDLADAPPALGSPRVVAGGCAPIVVYRGTDQHVHELAWTGARWVHTDLAQVRGTLATSDDPAGVMGADGVLRVVYRGPDGQLHELENGGGWIHRDL